MSGIPMNKIWPDTFKRSCNHSTDGVDLCSCDKPIMPVLRKKEDLSVICYLWGNWCNNWGPKYVNKLYRSVQRHLSLPHRFICFTDKPDHIKLDAGIERKILDVPKEWEWNHKKMMMYKPDNGLTGRVLCLDLDIVIVGCIDDIARYSDGFITCASPYRRRMARIGGSIVGFDAGYGQTRLYAPMTDPERYSRIQKITQGSERLYYRMMLRKDGVNYWDEQFSGHILSYKQEVGENCSPPEGTRIVYFHGRPRPHERRYLKWVEDNWK